MSITLIATGFKRQEEAESRQVHSTLLCLLYAHCHYVFWCSSFYSPLRQTSTTVRLVEITAGATAVGFLHHPRKKAQHCRSQSFCRGKGVQGFPEAETSAWRKKKLRTLTSLAHQLSFSCFPLLFLILLGVRYVSSLFLLLRFRW